MDRLNHVFVLTKLSMEQRDFHAPAIEERVGSKNQWVLLKSQFNWGKLESLLRKTDNTGEQGGRPPYSPLLMFRAMLLGQWHDLSDEDLEYSLKVRLDFAMFCGLSLSEAVPDRTTLGKFRNKLVEQGLLPLCLKTVNEELERLGLKLSKCGEFIVDATIIRSQARPRNVIEVSDDDDEPPTKTTSKDPDAHWVKTGKNFKYGYKQVTAVDAEDGYIEYLHMTPANIHEVTQLAPVVEGLKKAKAILADKGFASKTNSALLENRNIEDKIMKKAKKNSPLTDEQKQFNKQVSLIRYKVERTFGTQKRVLRFERSRYFGLARTQGQAFFKAICANLKKGMRKVFAPPRLAYPQG